MASKIEWTDETWNPITGCTKISEGCKNCYAERMAKRLAGRYGYPKDEPFKVTFHPDRLDQPLKWKKPKRIFVCSMGDLFHEDVSDEQIDSVFSVMAQDISYPLYGFNAPTKHTYIVLTKRPERILRGHPEFFARWPNIWLGVTIEHPKYGYRADYLRKIPAAVRFLSLEPLLADFSEYPGVLDDMNWCIIGSESGPNARPMKEDWVRKVVAQCKSAKIPVFYKQKLEGKKKISLPFLDGQQWAQYPTPGH